MKTIILHRIGNTSYITLSDTLTNEEKIALGDLLFDQNGDDVMMTKKERQVVHSEKCKIEAVEAQLGRGLETRHLVVFSLTAGELLAMQNTFIETEGRSPTQDDVAAFFRNALQRAGIKT